MLSTKPVSLNGNRDFARCLVRGFDGASFNQQWKDALWARFSAGAPARQRQSVEQYKMVKRDGAVAALPDGIAVCQKSGVLQPLSGKGGNRDERYNDGG